MTANTMCCLMVVQLDMLTAELARLDGLPMVMYGYMTLGVQPVRPTLRAERKPAFACVTAVSVANWIVGLGGAANG